MTPLQYVERADRELAFGRQRQAAALMWQATEAAFAALARAREWEGKDLLALAQALDAEKPVVPKHYLGGLVAGGLLRDYAEMEGLESCELQDAYQATRKFLLERNGEPQ